MVVTLSGMEMLLRLVHLSNAFSLISVTPLAISTVSRQEQSANALSPIDSTLEGILTLLSFSKDQKANAPIVIFPFPEKTMLLTLFLLLKETATSSLIFPEPDMVNTPLSLSSHLILSRVPCSMIALEALTLSFTSGSFSSASAGSCFSDSSGAFSSSSGTFPSVSEGLASSAGSVASVSFFSETSGSSFPVSLGAGF